ncbi:MAG: peptide-methionine (S)-S-oxide reductase, partial [Azospira oryzae]
MKNGLIAFLLVFTTHMTWAQRLEGKKTMSEVKSNLEKATFGNGCFWCTEAVFLELKGVQKVESGYSGGQVKNPTYREVCTGE